MQKFHVFTLGCKINQYESEAIEEAWHRRGLSPTADPGEADVVLVNSCAVTGRAVSDLRSAVRRLRRKNRRARVVVTGCAAQVLGPELAAMPGVDVVVPQERKADLLAGPPELDETGPGGTPPHGTSQDGREGRAFPPFRIGSFRRARAVVKVQDGCSQHCTYCIVPLTRGRSVSRDPADTLAEVRRLLGVGYRELVISGVNLREYGRDLPEGIDFWDLLAHMEAALASEWAGRIRLRLSSLEPGMLGPKALDVLGSSRLIAPHLHLSLQSGDADILRRMGRGHYRPGQVRDFVDRLAGFWPRFALGADLLTGFPGETAEQFANTYAFCRDLPLTYAHVFPFSSRPGTPAAGWPDTLTRTERTTRAARLRGLAEAKKRAFRKELAGLPRLTVLIESVGADSGQGTCEYYVPCIVRGAGLRRGGLVPVRPVGLRGPKLVCDALPEEP